jgi:hypothetical protein
MANTSEVYESGGVNNCLAGGGEMGALMRSVQWVDTPLGTVEKWSPSLRTTVGVCLNSRFPILVWWGPDFVMLYNDAYRPMLGQSKHPQAMGRPGRECWPEIWHIIGPMLDGVLHRGEATWSDDQLLVLDRNGYLEECYFTFSYSPIREDSGNVGGVFCAVTETTERVLNERRLQTLRMLGEQTTHARRTEDACDLAVSTLGGNAHDVPFALLYLLDKDGTSAQLCATSSMMRGAKASPQTVQLGSKEDVWNFQRVFQTIRSQVA